MKITRLGATIAVALCLPPTPVVRAGSRPAAEESARSDLLQTTMQQELQRAQAQLGKLDPAPYFLSYSVHDQDVAAVLATEGAILTSTHARRRSADVSMRLGSNALDNSHQQNRASAIDSGILPLDDDPDAVAHELWRLTYNEYRKAVGAYLNVKTKTQVDAKEEDTSPDFSEEKPHTAGDYRQLAPAPNQKQLEDVVRKYSGMLRNRPSIFVSMVMITAQRDCFHFVSSEGTRVVAPSATIRLLIQAETRADDGMDLMRVETFQADRLEQLPSEKDVAARIEKMASDLKDLRAAPVAEPFDGPALLSGRAAAVFFHEVLGHRLEGQRQRGEQEGQTFTKKINERILPDFLSVTDDPTLPSLNGVPLSGWYEYDDEGVPAIRVELIRNGVLETFLMSRMPVKSFAHSNGHGRAQAGRMPTGRQGNLIVTSSKTTKDSELRQRLIEEVKRQGKPYGLYFEDIQGGFTLTSRALPQAFQVLPVMVWRVYPDGRADELVRGVSIVGTPLAAMSNIVLTGDKVAVFNGMCGAESGMVPVAAAAPAVLLSGIEIQKQPHSLSRPPILPPPSESENTPTKGGRP